MFAKVMYLADLEEFIPREQGAAVQQRLKEIFGATDEDYEKLRIDALGSRGGGHLRPRGDDHQEGGGDWGGGRGRPGCRLVVIRRAREYDGNM